MKRIISIVAIICATLLTSCKPDYMGEFYYQFRPSDDTAKEVSKAWQDSGAQDLITKEIQGIGAIKQSTNVWGLGGYKKQCDRKMLEAINDGMDQWEAKASREYDLSQCTIIVECSGFGTIHTRKYKR